MAQMFSQALFVITAFLSFTSLLNVFMVLPKLKYGIFDSPKNVITDGIFAGIFLVLSVIAFMLTPSWISWIACILLMLYSAYMTIDSMVQLSVLSGVFNMILAILFGISIVNYW